MSKNGAKHWCGTINNFVDEDIGEFENSQELLQYFVYGKEVGASGTKHLQWYCCFKKRTALQKLKQLWPRAHCEVMQTRDPARAANYCKKGEQSKEEWDLHHERGPNFGLNAQFVEYGTLPETAAIAGGRATAQKWVEAKEKAQIGELETIDPCIYVTNYRNLKQIKYDSRKDPKDLTAPCGEWIWGPTGVGKSRTARMENPDCYKKPMNKWWDHYDGEDVVLLEDMSPAFGQSMEYFMKIWPDCYAFPAEIKNHITNIRPKKIVVTSQYHPSQIWNGEALDAILRRFTIREIQKLQQNDSTVSKKRPVSLIASRKLPQLKKPALYKQNAQGNLVENKPTQPLLNKQFKPIVNTNVAPTQIIDLSRDETCSECLHLTTDCKCDYEKIEISAEGRSIDESDSSDSDSSSDSSEESSSDDFM